MQDLALSIFCALEKLVDFFSSRKHPIVVVFNYGATVKCACDDVKCAGDRLVAILKKTICMNICKFLLLILLNVKSKRAFGFM